MATPEPTGPEAIRTPRLLLRPPRLADAVHVEAGVRESLAALRRFPASLPWAQAEPSLEASQAFCRVAPVYGPPLSDMPFLILDHRGSFIGCTGLHRIDWTARRFEVGYWLRTSMTRQGYATEAVRAVVLAAIGRWGARRVEAIADEDNAASRAVLERSGFRLEAVVKEEGTSRTRCVYAASELQSPQTTPAPGP